MIRSWVILGLGLTGLSPAWAQEAPSPAPQAAPPASDSKPDDPRVVDLQRLFSDFCVKKFPDDAALASAVEMAGGTAMTAEEVKARLHDDPGRGWQIAAGEANFNVTLEAPPYHACAVRISAEKPVVGKGIVEMLKSVAAEQKHGLSKPLVLPAVPIGGVVTLAVSYDVMNEDGSPIAPKEAFMLIIDVDTKAPHPNADTRLVHQIAQ